MSDRREHALWPTFERWVRDDTEQRFRRTFGDGVLSGDDEDLLQRLSDSRLNHLPLWHGFVGGAESVMNQLDLREG